MCVCMCGCVWYILHFHFKLFVRKKKNQKPWYDLHLFHGSKTFVNVYVFCWRCWSYLRRRLRHHHKILYKMRFWFIIMGKWNTRVKKDTFFYGESRGCCERKISFVLLWLLTLFQLYSSFFPIRYPLKNWWRKNNKDCKCSSA